MQETPKIIGLGTAVPEQSYTQSEALDHYHLISGKENSERETSRVLYRLSRVGKRHSVLLGNSESPRELSDFYPPDFASAPTTAERMRIYENEAPQLAHTASTSAIENSGVSREEITHLVTISCTGFYAPGIDVHLIRSLGLKPTVHRTHIGFMGCYGALSGIQNVAAIIGSDPFATVLMCCVELCSLHFSYQERTDHLVSNSLFSDGAAAVVVRSSKMEDRKGWSCRTTSSFLLPGTEDLMAWKIGDHGFEMDLSALLANVIERELPAFIGEWLASHSLAVEQVKGWAVHPGGPRILTSVETALKLPSDALFSSRQVLREYGNMSSATVLFVLDQLSQGFEHSPCIMLAFGPGVVCEAALLEL